MNAQVMMELQPAVVEGAISWTAWVAEAEQRYGFDHPTARRLAFLRWLFAMGRLREW
jgi:hypothetical protein